MLLQKRHDPTLNMINLKRLWSNYRVVNANWKPLVPLTTIALQPKIVFLSTRQLQIDMRTC